MGAFTPLRRARLRERTRNGMPTGLTSALPAMEITWPLHAPSEFLEHAPPDEAACGRGEKPYT